MLFPLMASGFGLKKKLVIQFEGFLNEINEMACDAEISSGFRTPRINTQVGGAIHSYHLKGAALDLIFPDCKLTIKELSIIAKKYFNGVIYYPKHIHVDIRDAKYYTKGQY